MKQQAMTKEEIKLVKRLSLLYLKEKLTRLEQIEYDHLKDLLQDILPLDRS
jgi:uncharacterized protein YqfB (UPF0267 family)